MNKISLRNKSGQKQGVIAAWGEQGVTIELRSPDQIERSITLQERAMILNPEDTFELTMPETR